jgi:hypothetical protein
MLPTITLESTPFTQNQSSEYIWNLKLRFTFRAMKFLTELNINFEFHFIKKWNTRFCQKDANKKNEYLGTQLWEVVLLHKQNIGLVCPCNKINDEISFNSIKKGFWAINLEDRSPQDIVE